MSCWKILMNSSYIIVHSASGVDVVKAIRDYGDSRLRSFFGFLTLVPKKPQHRVIGNQRVTEVGLKKREKFRCYGQRPEVDVTAVNLEIGNGFI